MSSLICILTANLAQIYHNIFYRVFFFLLYGGKKNIWLWLRCVLSTVCIKRLEGIADSSNHIWNKNLEWREKFKYDSLKALLKVCSNLLIYVKSSNFNLRILWEIKGFTFVLVLTFKLFLVIAGDRNLSLELKFNLI